MKGAEEAAFARGITADTLMEAAGAGIAHFISTQFSQPGRCLAFVGKGHNGGDALVAARHLRERGWDVEERLAFPEADCSELTRRKLQTLHATAIPIRETQSTRLVVLDGLLGVGATPPLRDPVSSSTREINRLRRDKNAYVFAVDLPTGLDSDSGAADEDAVVADFTITVAFPKSGLIADQALEKVGRLEVVRLAELQPPGEVAETVTTAETIAPLFPRRSFGAYKNQSGRVGIVAGSPGLTGAAVLCALGALRGGAGLVNLFVREDIYSIVATMAPPEAMVRPINALKELLDLDVEIASWAIGPGLGLGNTADVRMLVEQLTQAAVVDADGITAVSEEPGLIDRCRGPRLFTPHPGEMKRLLKRDGARAEIAREFTKQHGATLLFKGSRTIVAERGHHLAYNTTGNPGMATGGMGDVLTGVCAALIAQGLSPYDAARAGAWLCGRAAELAIFQGNQSEQSLLPRDVVAHLGMAFAHLWAEPAC